MTEAPTDLILPILRKIQEDVASLHKEMVSLQKSVDVRFDAVDVQLRKQRRDSAGMLVIMRGAAGQFDERFVALENRVAALERRPS